MGILLQIYFFFPWIRIDGGYHTIHVYLIEIFRKESCIKAYNYISYLGIQSYGNIPVLRQ